MRTGHWQAQQASRARRHIEQQSARAHAPRRPANPKPCRAQLKQPHGCHPMTLRIERAAIASQPPAMSFDIFPSLLEPPLPFPFEPTHPQKCRNRGYAPAPQEEGSAHCQSNSAGGRRPRGTLDTGRVANRLNLKHRSICVVAAHRPRCASVRRPTSDLGWGRSREKHQRRIGAKSYPDLCCQSCSVRAVGQKIQRRRRETSKGASGVTETTLTKRPYLGGEREGKLQ